MMDHECKCGGRMEPDFNNPVLLTLPPKYCYKCKSCGEVKYFSEIHSQAIS